MSIIRIYKYCFYSIKVKTLQYEIATQLLNYNIKISSSNLEVALMMCVLVISDHDYKTLQNLYIDVLQTIHVLRVPISIH